MRLCFLLLLALLLPALPARTAELKLATWNIAWLTLRAHGDTAVPQDVPPRQAEDFALLAEYARKLDADVVALQEIDGAEAAARVFDPGQYQLIFAEERDVQRTGFAVHKDLKVTRHPDLAALDLYPGGRFSLRRGTDITVEAGDTRLRLLSIHLKGGCRDEPLDTVVIECGALAQQAHVLSAWAAERRREGIAFAILGDFNRSFASPDDRFRAILDEAGPLTRVTEGFGNPCWSGPRSPKRFIDHIILGGAARAWWSADSLRVLVYAERDRRYRTRLSDHCPLSIRLRLPD
jgi:endonuclease/exonuclease/phosphatase family metal-dependent hydrolase